MTAAPADLLDLRAIVMDETGLTDPASVGIVGDGAHQKTGGYHEGRDVLVMIGRYHPSAAAGSSGEDYSCRLARDRAGLTNSSSGVDIGYRWPRGGNVAWLRFNNLLVNQLTANDPMLSAVRAVNYSPDGSAKRRRDRESGWALQTSTDTVDVHTHIEFYRDTEGRRQPTIARLGQIAHVAVAGGTSMAGSGITMAWGETLDAYISRIEKIWVPAAAAATAMPATLAQLGAKLDGANTALTTQGQTIAHLVDLLGQTGSPDVAPLVAQLQQVTAELQALTEKESEQSTLIEQLQARLAAAAHAEAAALDG